MYSLKSAAKTPERPRAAAVVGRFDETIKLAGQSDLVLRIHRGAAATSVVVHFHGGTFVGGSLDSSAPVIAALTAAGAVVVSVDYPLAPRSRFPDAIEAGHAALLWAQRQRGKLAGADAPLFVAGEEAGGNLAAAVALMARDRHQPALSGQILLSPMLNPCMATQSLREAEAGKAGCCYAQGWHGYLRSAVDADHPYAAPGLATRLAGLPPTLLLSAQDDPLRDETRAYAQRLREAGVEVSETVLPAPTGWPRSLLCAAADDAPWTSGLRDAVEAFVDPRRAS